MTTRQLTLGAVLTALALVIPFAFGFLRIFIPPAFTMTLASHVPSMLAMFISPAVAGIVGLGSALGFTFALAPVIGMRAAIHIIWGVWGAILFRKGMDPKLVLALMLPLHALGEALVVLPFGYELQQALVVVGIGTAIHHVLDSIITLLVYGSLGNANINLAQASDRR